MVKIKHKGPHNNLNLAVGTVNALLMNIDFYKRIGQKEHFDMANVSPSDISEFMRRCNIEMTVDFYYSILPFSNAITYDDIHRPNCIWLNMWNIKQPVDVLCNTLMHQCIHAVNKQFPQYSFGHGDNNAYEKDNTAPYWIACLAQKMFLNDDSQPCHFTVHEDAQYIPRAIYAH